MKKLKNVNSNKDYVNDKPDFKEKEIKRTERMIRYEPDLDEVIYLLSKEIDYYR